CFSTCGRMTQANTRWPPVQMVAPITCSNNAVWYKAGLLPVSADYRAPAQAEKRMICIKQGPLAGTASDAALAHPCTQGGGTFLAFGVTIRQVVGAVTQQPGELHQLLQHVDDTVVIGRLLHAIVLVKLQPRLRHRRLVGDGEHAHPATKDAQLVDGIERLRAAADLHDRKRLALRWPYRTDR